MTIGILIMLSLALAFIVFFNRSQRKIFEERMRVQELQLEHQQQLLYSNILTQEEERKRIAKDLHDEVGSKLNVIHLNLHRLRKAAPSSPALEETVSEIFAVINDTIDTTRRISHDLLPPTLENFGLKEAIKELCESYRKVENITFQFELIQNEARPTDKMVEVNFFRVLQEFISNSLKHGDPSQINIRLWLNSNGLRLEYADNGKGFDLDQLQTKSGLGMQNIESRMNMIHAEYDIKTTPMAGFMATLKYMYPNDSSSLSR
ncbi:MAG: sensor histidine kinase [Saprospiraceae bacterium]